MTRGLVGRSEDKIAEFIARAKDKNDPFRLMGFGHRERHNNRCAVEQQL